MKNKQLSHQHHTPTPKTYPICFLAHDIDIPTNIGSLFRIADALGVEKIYLSGSSAVPPNSKIRKTARSTETSVPFAYNNDPLIVLQDLTSQDYRVISLEITSTSIEIEKLSINDNEKICLILGAENAGINQALLDASDETIYIPMLGKGSSMNVAMACSIATFEITKKLKLR